MPKHATVRSGKHVTTSQANVCVHQGTMVHSAKDDVKLAAMDGVVQGHVTVLVRLHVTH